MRPHKVIINLVHGNNGRVIYLYAPHDLLSFSDAAMHPLKHVVEAFLNVRAVLWSDRQEALSELKA
jgi:hypothetical protein